MLAQGPGQRSRAAGRASVRGCAQAAAGGCGVVCYAAVCVWGAAKAAGVGGWALGRRRRNKMDQPIAARRTRLGLAGGEMGYKGITSLCAGTGGRALNRRCDGSHTACGRDDTRGLSKDGRGHGDGQGCCRRSFSQQPASRHGGSTAVAPVGAYGNLSWHSGMRRRGHAACRAAQGCFCSLRSLTPCLRLLAVLSNCLVLSGCRGRALTDPKSVRQRTAAPAASMISSFPPLHAALGEVS